MVNKICFLKSENLTVNFYDFNWVALSLRKKLTNLCWITTFGFPQGMTSFEIVSVGAYIQMIQRKLTNTFFQAYILVNWNVVKFLR